MMMSSMTAALFVSFVLSQAAASQSCCMNKQDVDSQLDASQPGQSPHAVVTNMHWEGLNNVFLIETSHELALRYNDSRMHRWLPATASTRHVKLKAASPVLSLSLPRDDRRRRQLLLLVRLRL